MLEGKDQNGNPYPSPPDTGFEDYRIMGVFGGKQKGNDSLHYYDPMARYTAQNYDPANNNADITFIISFEHQNKS